MSGARLALTEVTPRVVYEVKSRNLRVAVCVGDGKFIGIRNKFKSRFLDAEWHWETGPPYGTLWPLRQVGSISDKIDLVESFGSVCRNCRLPVEWTGPPAPAPWVHQGDTDCTAVQPISDTNEALFEALDAIQRSVSGEELR